MSDLNGELLPKGWAYARLVDVSWVTMGQSPPSSTYNAHAHGLPFIQGKAEFGELYPKQRVWCSQPGKTAKENDILLSVRAPVGPTNLAPGPCCIGRGLAAIRPSGTVCTKYLLYALRRFSAELDSKGTGTTFKAVSGDVVRGFVLPIAPSAEQVRIAETLDELLSDLDAGVAALERARTKLGHYRAAVLKAAVEGSLTSEWRKQHPNAEPASELLKRVLIERRKRWQQEQLRKYAEAGKKPPANWKAKYKEPVPPPDMSEAAELPQHWTIASADALMSRITSGSRDWLRYYDKGDGTFIMAQNVRPGRLDLSWRQQVDPPSDDSSCERSQVHPHDLLVTIVGANTGDVCRVRESLPRHYVCQSVTLMRPVDARLSAYLECYSNSLAGAQAHYRRYIYGAGRPHLSFDQLKMTPVLIPPLAEQYAIVEAVEDQLSVIDHLEADLEAKLRSALGLRQSILRHAFSGKLVPQDPSDEPASELLKRIAAERAERERQLAVQKRARKQTRKRRKKAERVR